MLLDSLSLTFCLSAFVAGKFGAPWWFFYVYLVGIPVAAFYRARSARDLMTEVELVRAMPRRIQFPTWSAEAMQKAAPKINAAMRAATAEMIQNIEARRVTHGNPPDGPLLTRPLWTGTFLGGPLDGTDETLPADFNGVPPLVHTHTEWTSPGPLTYECLTHYKLIDLDPKRRRANYEYQRDGFTVTAERYEQLRRAVRGEQG